MLREQSEPCSRAHTMERLQSQATNGGGAERADASFLISLCSIYLRGRIQSAISVVPRSETSPDDLFTFPDDEREPRSPGQVGGSRIVFHDTLWPLASKYHGSLGGLYLSQSMEGW